jgi:hypothetical protein
MFRFIIILLVTDRSRDISIVAVRHLFDNARIVPSFSLTDLQIPKNPETLEKNLLPECRYYMLISHRFLSDKVMVRNLRAVRLYLVDKPESGGCVGIQVKGAQSPVSWRPLCPSLANDVWRRLVVIVATGFQAHCFRYDLASSDKRLCSLTIKKTLLLIQLPKRHCGTNKSRNSLSQIRFFNQRSWKYNKLPTLLQCRFLLIRDLPTAMESR